MPICPKCSSKFHRGAEAQCPCCGYSLLEANGIFGNRAVPLARIADSAGILTHKERVALARFLERLERRVPPAALCVYVTDHGRLADFRSHAHWALNHARPRHETFGKRGRAHALDEPRILVREPGAVPEEETPSSRFREWKEELAEVWRDLIHPVPPPVRPEWTLLLVLDVQLETACFAWGYMLDPYIDPDRINTTLMKRARQLFRERQTRKALELVMEGAALHLARRARARKKRFSLEQLWGKGATVPALAAASLLLPQADAVPLHDLPDLPPLPPASSPAAAPAPSPTGEQSGYLPPNAPGGAEGAASPAANESGQAPPPEGTPESSETEERFPSAWTPGDRDLLLMGSWWRNMPQLFPGTEEAAPEAARTARSRKPDDADVRTPSLPESETAVPEMYVPLYLRPESSGLIDPQNLLSEPQKNDVRRLLGELHRHGACRFYVALFGGSQRIPLALAPQKLVAQIGKLQERSVLVHYRLGDAASLGIAYDAAFLKELTDEQRRAWLLAVGEAAATYAHGPDALHAALTTLAAQIGPVADALPPRSAEETDALALGEEETPPQAVALVPISVDRAETQKKADWRTRLRALPDDPAFAPVTAAAGGLLAALGVLFLVWRIRRRNARLKETAADIRLSSPAGAGVSRVVHYMEGREAGGDARNVL